MSNRLKRVHPKGRKNARKRKRSPGVFGTSMSPPKATGMVQVPMTIRVRPQVYTRVFKIPLTLSSVAAQAVNISYSFSLYSPFNGFGSTGATGTFTAFDLGPSDLEDMMSTFDLYKPRVLQILFEPLLIPTIVPYPFYLCMDFTSKGSIALSPSAIQAYPNSSSISPAFPTAVKYLLPPASNLSSSTGVSSPIVLNKGWLDTGLWTSNSVDYSTYGNVFLAQSDLPAASTTYSKVTLIYEISFKNPI
jgi:hypothetical protein